MPMLKEDALPPAALAHASGLGALGRFVPAPPARDFVESSFFCENSIPALFRFSVGHGDPHASDSSRTVRGMEVHMCGQQEDYDLVLISEPVFVAGTPQSFLGYLLAHTPDPASGRPDPARIAAHRAAHPRERLHDSLLACHPAPRSYATTAYHSAHAFRFSGKQHAVRTARLVARPDSGVRYLSEQEEQDFPPRFLEREMDERLLRGPIGFRLYAQLPAEGDPLEDCSQAWLGEACVLLGRLQVDALSVDGEAFHFLPTRLPLAIAPSCDPLLCARGHDGD